MQTKIIVTKEIKQAVWHWYRRCCECQYIEEVIIKSIWPWVKDRVSFKPHINFNLLPPMCSIGSFMDVRCVIIDGAAESALEISGHKVGDAVYVTHEEKLAIAHMINYYNARDL